MTRDVFGLYGPPNDLLTRVQDEADLCRNEGANDIANLLDEVAAALQARPEVAAVPPDGWKSFTWPEGQRTGLCHADHHWWNSPKNNWYCGTCHKMPWLGLGFKHALSLTFDERIPDEREPQSSAEEKP